MGAAAGGGFLQTRRPAAHQLCQGGYVWAGRPSSQMLWAKQPDRKEHKHFRKNWNAKFGMGQENATGTLYLSKREPFPWR